MLEQYDDLYTAVVLDDSGTRVGSVSQLYLDDATGEPTFVTARTGLFGNKEVCVPLSGAVVADGLVQVPHPIDLIKLAPVPSPERHLDPEDEAQVYRHYGLPFTVPDQAPPAADQPAGQDPAAQTLAPPAPDAGATPDH